MDIQRNQRGTKITWGEHKCAQKGVKKKIGENRMPTKEKPKTHTQRNEHTLGECKCTQRGVDNMPKNTQMQKTKTHKEGIENT